MPITTQSELREFFGEPSKVARKKQQSKLDKHCRHFIALSPFLVLASSGADGSADASPKGDPAGFVAVLDDHTLLIPDRPGNKRVDTMQNLLANPHVGMVFFVPGMNETLRVNGRAEITTDEALLAPLAVNGRVPRSGLLVHVEEAYLHCAKALVRSQLWNADNHIDRKSFPTAGQIYADQVEGLDPEEVQRGYEERTRTGLY